MDVKTPNDTKAKAVFEQSEGANLLTIGGTWRLMDPFPVLEEVIPQELKDSEIRAVPRELAEWDSSLPLFLLRVRAWCNERKVKMTMGDLPAGVKRLFELILESEKEAPKQNAQHRPPPSFNRFARHTLAKWKHFIEFLGECIIEMAEAPTKPRHIHWKAFFNQMVEAGPKALPIIGLICFLVGLTFAYETSIQLRRFGLQFYMVSAVATSILREIGPLIAAILLAGRTGAAFAAHIANMKLENETAALEIIGVSPISFLVLPRVAALVITIPFTTLYSDLCGILGPLIIAVFKLNVPVRGFLAELHNSVSLADVLVGLVKSVVFAILIGLAGTLHGMQSERTSAGLGRAVTAAVVTGIACILAADALFSPILEHLGF
ncbi:MAG TPA: ABC transporter permease [Verrucomicrobiae bacterium]|jgi:phospholipid/cholesterol/gamma-HCH transport system permease protein|nr:ABC transporter permease [Verrucomicrobiae bacterium]